MFLLPPTDHCWVHLILASDLGQQLASLDLVDDLKLELTGELTTFKSQGRGLLPLVKEA
jgi:hypothetical protein